MIKFKLDGDEECKESICKSGLERKKKKTTKMEKKRKERHGGRSVVRNQ